MFFIFCKNLLEDATLYTDNEIRNMYVVRHISKQNGKFRNSFFWNPTGYDKKEISKIVIRLVYPIFLKKAFCIFGKKLPIDATSHLDY